MPNTGRKVELIGANGARHTLVCDDDGPYDLRPDSGLWGMTGYAIQSRRSVAAAGEIVDSVQPLPRTFKVPILVKGTTENDVDLMLGNLARLLDPNIDIRIVFWRADGSKREIVARYLSGGENLAVPHPDKRHIIVPLVFRAFHPFWRGVNDEGEEVTDQFFDAGFGGANPVFILNRGDVKIWPEIVLTGPAENIEAASLTTGKVFRIIRNILPGHVIRIDSNPETRRVLVNDFPDYAGSVDPFSEFWPLLPGWNNVVIRGVSPLNEGKWNVRFRAEYDTC